MSNNSPIQGHRKSIEKRNSHVLAVAHALC